jgi:hypothetical protein
MNETRDPQMDELERMFRRRERDVSAPPGLSDALRRQVRRRQVRFSVVAGLTTLAVVAGGILVAGNLDRPSPPPADAERLLPAGEQKTAVLPELGITYSGGWQLVVPSYESDRQTPYDHFEVQLRNFDAPLDGNSAFICADGTVSGLNDRVPFPPGGVLLSIESGNGTIGAEANPWPAELQRSDMCAPYRASPFQGQTLTAEWSPDGGATPVTAVAFMGAGVGAEDRQRVLDAFASLTFPRRRGSLWEDTDTPTQVVDASAPGEFPWLVTAFTSDRPGLSVAGGDGPMLTIAGPESFVRDPSQYVAASTPVGAGTLVFGVVSPRATAVQVTPDSAAPIPATITPPISTLHATFNVFSIYVPSSAPSSAGTVTATSTSGILWSSPYNAGEARSTTDPDAIPPGGIVWSGNETLGTRWVMIMDSAGRQSMVTETGDVLATDNGRVPSKGAASVTTYAFHADGETMTEIFGTARSDARWVNVVPWNGDPVYAVTEGKGAHYYMAELAGDPVGGLVVALDDQCHPIHSITRWGSLPTGWTTPSIILPRKGWTCPAD